MEESKLVTRLDMEESQPLVLRKGMTTRNGVGSGRGCKRGGPNKEYTGPKANGQDDEMCIKVQSVVIPAENGYTL